MDASHHQGDIDWRRVAGAGLGFAYLKASEGTGFVDDRFVTNSEGARRAGLRVGGYHYFSLCSSGAEQGDHFAATLTDAGRLTLPPAVDLELQGQSCSLPERAELLTEVRAFLTAVERATGREVVVYQFPEFTTRYDLGADLGRRQWVRRLGDRPPAGSWWMWQRADSARVPGISGPADVNVLRGSV